MYTNITLPSAIAEALTEAIAKGVPQELPNVRVGCSALIRNEDGKFLVSERIGSHGSGTLQTPGGHLEHGESPFICVVRETEEETRMIVKAENIITITNDVFEGEHKHYITIWVLCTMTDPKAVPEIVEPDKCKGWSWLTLEELHQINDAAKIKKEEKKAKGEKPAPPSGDELFLPLINLLKQEPNLHHFFDAKKGVLIGPNDM